jgi:DNA replication protein DnaC
MEVPSVYPTALASGIPTTPGEPSSEQDLESERQRRLLAAWRSRNPYADHEPTADELEEFRQRMIEQARDAHQQRAAANIERLIGDVGELYRDATLESYEVRNSAQQTVVSSLAAYCQRGRDNVRAGRGIILYGPSGSGKDHLLIGVAKKAIGGGFNVSAVTGPTLASELRGLIDSGEPEGRFFERYTGPDVLLLSDPVPPGGTLTAFQAEGLYRIVDARYRAKRAIWSTINVSSGAEADQRVGSAIVDRLRDGALCLPCNWPSYRRPWGTEETAQ